MYYQMCGGGLRSDEEVKRWSAIRPELVRGLPEMQWKAAHEMGLVIQRRVRLSVVVLRDPELDF